MGEAAMLALALVACVLGFGWLALAMEVHWQQAFGNTKRSLSAPTRLRILGALLLAVALGLCLAVDHVSMASLVWLMTLAAAAMIVAFTLSWRPQILAWLIPWVRPSSLERG